MSDELKNQDQENRLDFEKATDLTVGQASRKAAEIEAGVTDGDSAIEKYIKQHRAEIEAGKFDLQASKEEVKTELADFIQEQREELEPKVEDLAEEGQEVEVATPDPLEERGMDAVALEEAVLSENTGAPSSLDLPSGFENGPASFGPQESNRKKYFLYGGLGILVLALIAGSAVAYNLSNSKSQGKTLVSTVSSSKKSSSSSSSQDPATAFTDLYETFYLDGEKTSLNNEAFGKLDQLKGLLDQLKDHKDYETYKKQYEDLVKQVTAIQKVNSQFESPAIENGKLNTQAKAKADANFEEVSTGNEKLDGLLRSAVEQGKEQTIAAPAPQAANPTAGQADASSSQVAAPATGGQAANTLIPNLASDVVNGVRLQRELSRVPYSQAMLNDVNNPAWNFNPGVLENILQVSRQRGYFTGDQYYLERVNIINGNGYYNLFKSDGTYLFSINCKTGYFVGNGKGYADSLDY